MYDLMIENGYIIDGTENSGYIADIGILNKRIVSIGNLKSESAEKKIDATNKVVSPGFIDIHSHSDFNILNAPFESNKIFQGITTEVTGHCGYSLFPVTKESLPHFELLLKSNNIKLNIDWLSAKDCLNKVDLQGIGVNFLSLVGHGILRMLVMGFQARKASEEEVEKMKKLLVEVMEDGAYGLSTGLGYPPGCFADTSELIELAKVVKRYDGVFTCHLRDQGDHLIESVKEIIKVAEESGVAVDISHIKSMGKKNWGKVKEALELVEEARKRGVNIICDFYPYIGTNEPLISLLPKWMHEGGNEKLIERLKDEKILKDLEIEMREKDADYWSSIIIAEVKSEKNKSLEGMTVAEVSDLWDKKPIHTVCELLLVEYCSVSVICKVTCEEDLKYVAKKPFIAIGTDGFALPDNIYDYKGHPRNFGTFPRFLGKLIREEGVATLEEGIRRITSLPAIFLGIKERGLLKEGMYADIVIFDDEKISDRGTYENPGQYPEGIDYVIVNGNVQIENGNYNRKSCGKVLRKK
ncbi:MAG: D-aminoacylase [Halanaerobiales bacterium]|nr:D-aminoacylase [Halanaerobiales bacterium]